MSDSVTPALASHPSRGNSDISRSAMFDPVRYGVWDSSSDSELDGEEPGRSTGLYISISDGVASLKIGKQHQDDAGVTERDGRPINGYTE
ncbi:MAG: hypothetical protein CBC65_002155 [Rhodothermaceae bacterium TMED105]|nr:MAG: hypothetical protein CBC65_002155 [Rhodothermaceae bacterium TMED105]